eukprot:TRINITY_DN8141_c0_g3_i1.p1 TRINITY_DN8141_c0_g3~~TRINITY_DN8141_c0_g3_i1.p1  ORF type:complete len:360 (+),score=104.82 TRINITY_DN8141_c0_g3_i1:95-1174(+)
MQSWYHGTREAQESTESAFQIMRDAQEAMQETMQAAQVAFQRDMRNMREQHNQHQQEQRWQHEQQQQQRQEQHWERQQQQWARQQQGWQRHQQRWQRQQQRWQRQQQQQWQQNASSSGNGGGWFGGGFGSNTFGGGDFGGFQQNTPVGDGEFGHGGSGGDGHVLHHGISGGGGHGVGIGSGWTNVVNANGSIYVNGQQVAQVPCGASVNLQSSNGVVRLNNEVIWPRADVVAAGVMAEVEVPPLQQSFMPPASAWLRDSPEEDVGNVELQTLRDALNHSRVGVCPNDREEPCSVCTDSIATGQKTRTLPCFHVLHRACAEAYFSAEAKIAAHQNRRIPCPVCRHDVGPELVEILDDDVA